MSARDIGKDLLANCHRPARFPRGQRQASGICEAPPFPCRHGGIGNRGVQKHLNLKGMAAAIAQVAHVLVRMTATAHVNVALLARAQDSRGILPPLKLFTSLEKTFKLLT